VIGVVYLDLRGSGRMGGTLPTVDRSTLTAKWFNAKARPGVEAICAPTAQATDPGIRPKPNRLPNGSTGGGLASSASATPVDVVWCEQEDGRPPSR
jgi:hypothetical protein